VEVEMIGRKLAWRYTTALSSVAVLFIACESRSSSPVDAEGELALSGSKSASAQLVKDVRRATSRFHSEKQAEKAGYVTTVECVAIPIGAMGIHFVNESLTDPVFDPLHPEALLYEPKANGRHRLIGVEYIVIDVGQPAPTFAGHPFDVGGTPVPVPHWSLHVWVYEDNPLGLHAPFNPNVSCSG
jgi:hypothetical protein